MSKQPFYEVLEERLAHQGFHCFTREVQFLDQICYEVLVAHQDGRKGKMVSKRRTDALMSLIHILDMPELVAF